MTGASTWALARHSGEDPGPGFRDVWRVRRNPARVMACDASLVPTARCNRAAGVPSPAPRDAHPGDCTVLQPFFPSSIRSCTMRSLDLNFRGPWHDCHGVAMTAKLLPTALIAALMLGLLGSYAGAPVKRQVGQESCYRSQAGKGWVCLWESTLGEKCWRTDQASGCTKPSALSVQTGRNVVTKD